MTKRILCTTGTSIAQGCGRYEGEGKGEDYRRSIRVRMDQGRTEMGERFLEKISAETNSLSRYGLEKSDEAILLHTDTEDGRICAELVAELIRESLTENCSLQSIPGLQVQEAVEFRKTGIQNLISRMDRLRDERPDAEWVLNVTGGFKSVVPYMTLYGLIHRLDVIYLHETAGELIHLPPLPLTFDFERIGGFRDAIRALQQAGVMARKDFDALIPKELRANREWLRPLIEEEDGMVAPSGLASLFFKESDEHTVQVLIAQQATESLAASTGGLRKQYLGMLERVVDPLWRDSKIHPVHGTDLSVFKPGNTSARMIAYLKGRRVYVCELALHDRYEELLAGRRISDYPENRFQTYQAPVDAQDLPVSEELALEQLEAVLHTKEKEIGSLYEELSAKEQSANQIQQELSNTREVLEVQGTDLDEARLKVQNLKTQVQEIQTELQDYLTLPAWKRLFRKPPTLPSSQPQTR